MHRALRWIKKAVVSLIISDDSTYPRTQLSYNGVTTDAYRMSLYGLAANAPVGSLAIILSPDGRRDDPVALIDDPLNRFKDLEEGEVQVGSPFTGTSIKFRKDQGMAVTVAENGDLEVTVAGGNAVIDVTGDITVDATGNVTITAPTVTIDGNLSVTGTVTATGEVTGATKALSTHTHPDPVSGNTGPPN